MIVGVASLHISVNDMDGESWLLFALILAPALILFVWTAFKVQRDAKEVPGTADLGASTDRRKDRDESL